MTFTILTNNIKVFPGVIMAKHPRRLQTTRFELLNVCGSGVTEFLAKKDLRQREGEGQGKKV